MLTHIEEIFIQKFAAIFSLALDVARSKPAKKDLRWTLMNPKLIFSMILAFVVICIPAISYSAATAGLREQLEKDVSATVTVAKETADIQQKWRVEKRSLADETHALELELKLLEARSLKFEGYAEQRRQEITKLNKGLTEMAEIGLSLEPFLDELLSRVKDFQTGDLPFAVVERERRLADLEEALNSYEVDLPEKLSRMLEVLKIEAGFGRGFEVSEEVINRADGKTTVRVIRLGRVGLYYLTLDGSQVGWFNRTDKTWEKLPGGYSEAVKEALRMALKQRAFDLVKLPVTGGKP